MLAMDANDNACCLTARFIRTSIASMLAPTGEQKITRCNRSYTGCFSSLRGSSWVPAQSVERFTLVRSPGPRPDHHQCTG